MKIATEVGTFQKSLKEGWLIHHEAFLGAVVFDEDVLFLARCTEICR